MLPTTLLLDVKTAVADRGRVFRGDDETQASELAALEASDSDEETGEGGAAVRGGSTFAAAIDRPENNEERGLGATPHRPAVSCGEENLLRFPGDPYWQESLLIHEFAHAIHKMAVRELDPTFDRRLKETYQAAIKQGLWQGKYAGTNCDEYWAEGVQSWFDDNRPEDHDHNHVNTRKELIAYDPALAKLLRVSRRDLVVRRQVVARVVDNIVYVRDGLWAKFLQRLRLPDDLDAEGRCHRVE